MEGQRKPGRVRMFVMGVILGCVVCGLIVAGESWLELSQSGRLLALCAFFSGFLGKKDREKKPSIFAASLSGFLLSVTVIGLLAYWKLGPRYGFIVFALEFSAAFGIWIREEIDSKRQAQGGKSGTAR